MEGGKEEESGETASTAAYLNPKQYGHSQRGEKGSAGRNSSTQIKENEGKGRGASSGHVRSLQERKKGCLGSWEK